MPANVKSSNNPGVPDLEADGLGQWNDDVLTQIDQLMVRDVSHIHASMSLTLGQVDAHARGIKLLIAMHGGGEFMRWCLLR